jgi:hypothetical protein
MATLNHSEFFSAFAPRVQAQAPPATGLVCSTGTNGCCHAQKETILAIGPIEQQPFVEYFDF